MANEHTPSLRQKKHLLSYIKHKAPEDAESKLEISTVDTMGRKPQSIGCSEAIKCLFKEGQSYDNTWKMKVASNNSSSFRGSKNIKFHNTEEELGEHHLAAALDRQKSYNTSMIAAFKRRLEQRPPLPSPLKKKCNTYQTVSPNQPASPAVEIDPVAKHFDSPQRSIIEENDY